MRLTLFLCLTLPCVASAQSPQPDMTAPPIARLESGVICPPPSVGEVAAPGTVAGTTHVIEDEPPFMSLTNRVPAVLGIGFGTKSMADMNIGLSDVTMTVTHPAMGNLGATVQIFQTRIDGLTPSLTFYQFDYEYELVQGIWQMEASKNGQILYRTTFEVVAPTLVPELASICGFENLLS
jgi:hypothetical protein